MLYIDNFLSTHKSLDCQQGKEMGRLFTRSLFKTILVLPVALASNSMLYAQTPTFPDSLSPQSFVARTERFSSTHNASLALDYQLNQSLFAGQFRSYVLSSTTLLGLPITRDQVDFVADMQYELPSPVNLFLLFEGTMTNDVGGEELIPGLNNTTTTFAGVGARAADDEENNIGVAVGGAYSRQLNTEDAGGALYGEVSRAKTIGGYRFKIEGNGRWRNTSPRTNGTLFLDATFDRDFGDSIYFATNTSWELLHTDLYIKRREEDILQYGGDPLEGILKRRERRFRLGSFLLYPFNDQAGFDADLSVTSNGIGRWESDEGLPPTPREPEPYRYDQEDFAIRGSVGAWLEPPRARISARLSYRSGEQQNLVDPTGEVLEAELRRKRRTNALNDYLSTHLLFSGTVEYRPGNHDTVVLSGSAGIYRYDTPDTSNNFDKDEQTITSELRYARQFSRLLYLELTGQVFLTHLVYLFGENSNDNNWNRVIRLAPSVRYDFPDVLHNKMTAEVTANYTDYDFRGRTQNIRGRSFRELAIRDSLVFFFSYRYGLMTTGEMRIGERGSFSWSQFAESLLERTRTELLETELFSGRDSTSQYGVGGKLSRVRTFRADSRGALSPFSDRISVGPTARLSLPVTEKTRLEATGWWEHRFDKSELIGRTPWLFLTLDLML